MIRKRRSNQNKNIHTAHQNNEAFPPIFTRNRKKSRGGRGEEQFPYEKISVIVRRRSLAVERVSVCVPPPGAGPSSDKCDFAPIVRLPKVIRGCGRSVSEPDCDVHGDVALRGVVGVGAGLSFVADVVRLRASRRCSPFSALTLTVSGRENVIVVEWRLLLALDEED